MSFFNGRTATAAIMTSIFAAMVGMATQYPPDARLLPYVIGIPGLILCIAQLIIEIKAGGSEIPASDKRELESETWSELRYFLWFPAFVASVLAIGFLGTALVMVFVFLRFDQKETMSLSAGFAVGGVVVLYLVFELLLEMPLFRGLGYEFLIG